MRTKYKILFCLLATILATATLVYADDENEGGDATPSSMVGTDCTQCHGNKYASQAVTGSAQTGSGGVNIPASMVGTDCTQCHGNKYANLTASSGATTAAGSDGAALYQSNCAGCHQALNSSEVKKASASAITSAIKSNKGGMGKLSSLNATQIASIATALGNNSSSGGITTISPTQLPSVPTATLPTYGSTVDGATLYQLNCASCHGPLSASAKRGATPIAIQTAIGYNWGGMSYLSQLTLAQTQAISGVLSQVPAPAASSTTDGVSLYLVNCANCHGTLSASAVKGASVNSIQSAISGNWGGMGYLAGLSSVQIQAISTRLAPVAAALPASSQPVYATPSVSTSTNVTAASVPTAPDGVALYAANCASCHGALAASTKHLAAAGNIQSAIDSNWGGMGRLSNLTTVQIDAIATALY